MKIFTISSTHPDFGKNPEARSLYLHKWLVMNNGDRRLLDSWNLRYQGESYGNPVYRDTDGNFKEISAIADRHNAAIE